MTKTVYDYDRFVDLIKRHSCKGSNVTILARADSNEMLGEIRLSSCTGTFEATLEGSDRKIILHEQYRGELGIHLVFDDTGNERRRIVALSEVYQEVLFLRKSLPLAKIMLWNAEEHREYTQQEIEEIIEAYEKLGGLTWRV